MAVSKYTVKRGDTLWGIATSYSSSISGSTINAKIDTIVKLNKIKNRDLIYPGQVLTLNGSGSGSGNSPEPTNKPKITAFGLQAYNNTDSKHRAVFAQWDFTKDHIKHFRCRWEVYGAWTAGSSTQTWYRPSETTTTDVDDDSAKYPDTYCYSTFTADERATKVRFQVLPVAQNKKNSDKPYWKEGSGKDDVAWSDWSEYDFSNNPPLTPPTPSVTIDRIVDDQKLIMTIASIDPADIEANHVQFQIAKDNVSNIYTSGNIAIATNQVSCEHKVSYGSKYKVRARSVNSKGKESSWSDYSENVETAPLAPEAILDCSRHERSDGTKYVRIEWTPVANATNYVVEYVTNLSDFENSSGQVGSVETSEGKSFIEIFGLDSESNTGKTYFFRIRSKNSAGTGPYVGPVELTIGETPAAPTTWSSADSVFRGEPLELHWIHNSKDNSKQTYAQLSVNVNGTGWETFTFKNTTGPTTGERIDHDVFKYGTACSYKGEMYVLLDTESRLWSSAEIQWKVRTAGITKTFSDIDWSIERTVRIYEKPLMELSVTGSDWSDSTDMIRVLTQFPFYIRAKVLLDSYAIQHPVGYHLHVVSNSEYETIDETGVSKTVRSGDVIYSKYLDTSNVLNVEMTAADIDLESGITYTVRCVADMSTGLAIEQFCDFEVVWTDPGYFLDADIRVSDETLAAIIQPYCQDVDGNYVRDVTMSVYRRDYDGTLTEIASGIANRGTAVSDPHPALDYARYRIVARDNNTGSISFFDKIGTKVGCTSVVIQWDEEWEPFDLQEDNFADGLAYSGSRVILPYNVSITDDRKRDVALVNYAGRERPVSYHGVKISESSSWTTEIPKSDVDTIYALRKLSLWDGNVYVREPSGMGFWATVEVKFNVKYDSLTIPVTLSVTRVEGGA